MSSPEPSDVVDSSEDEVSIIARMHTKSGLPQKSLTVFNLPSNGEMLHSETSVATVKMSGGMIRHGVNLYDTSDSEDSYDNDHKNENVKLRDGSNSTILTSRNVLAQSKSSPNLTGHSSKRNSLPSSSLMSNSKFNAETTNSVKSNSASYDRINSLSSHKSNGNISITDKPIPSTYKEARFNPFDRDLQVEEDHFEDALFSQTSRTHFGRLKSDSTTSSTTTEANMTDSCKSDEITFADLGIAEDHFSQPEGYFGMSSTEELEMAIETCKDLIATTPPRTEKHKNLVKKLVQLRMKLQEIKEGPEPVEDGIRVVVGHKFKLNIGAGTKYFCEKCNSVIWGVLQQWFKCSECGYRTHDKCLTQITRTCASVLVRENPMYNMSICPQKLLSSQNYRCAECKAQIFYRAGYSEPRLCDYSGSFYCELCHWNDNMLIPARVVHNWDFTERKVCRASKQFLRLMEKKAVIRLWDYNPMLFNVVEELNDVKKFREELLIMKKYILLCTSAMESKLLLKLQNRQHFIENSDTYSMQDFIEVHKDILLPELARVHNCWAQHIKTDCEICRGKGFICGLCDADDILFPFDNIAVICSECSHVMHRHCFANKSGKCPKCERKRTNMQLKTDSHV